MPLIDLFATLAIPRDLVADFLAYVAHCGVAMKASHYMWEINGVAGAAWQRPPNNDGSSVRIRGRLEAAIESLVAAHSRLQIFSAGWQVAPLRGSHQLARAVGAAVRVRNNLFHGGKHEPEAAPGQDRPLVHAALTVLTAVVDGDRSALKRAFNGG